VVQGDRRMSRAEQVLEENKKLDDLIREIRELNGDILSNDNLKTLTLSSINKQLVDISITMALIYDLLNKKEI
jgi:hypothetical protein